MTAPAQSAFVIVALSLLASGVAIAPAAARESKEVQAIRQSAESGDPAAQLQLARAYDSGHGVKADTAAAAKWYEASAQQGNADAQNSIGSLYFNGEGVPLDALKACDWFAKAAAQGNPAGIGNLAYCYDAGVGVNKDAAKAAELYEQAANQGDLQSMFNVGIDYWKGDGVPKDLAKAYMWLDLVRFYTQTGRANRMIKWRARGELDALSREISGDDRQRGNELAKAWDAANRSKVQASTRY